MMKWVTLSIGIIATSSTLILPLSCVSKNKSLKQSLSKFNFQENENFNFYKNNYHRPFQFDELKEVGKNQPIMGNGIAKFAYYHGMSFIINVFRKIGFNLFKEDAKVENKKIININYYGKNNNQKNIEIVESIFNLINNSKRIKPPKSWVFGKKSTGFRIIGPLGFSGHLGSKYMFNFHLGYPLDDVDNRTGEFYDKKNNNSRWGIPSFYHIIDGLNPGKTILGFEVSNYNSLNNNILLKILSWDTIQKNLKWNFSFHFESYNGLIQKFNTINNKNKINEIKLLVKAMIRNLHFQIKYINDKNKQKIKIMHPTIIRMLNFVKNLNINDPKILKDIEIAVEELNNGSSHSLFGVELFARGIEGLPVRYAPGGPLKQISNEGTTNLIGMANWFKFNDVFSWGYSTQKGKKDLKGIPSKNNNEHFDPHTMIPIDNGGHHSTLWYANAEKTITVKRKYFFKNNKWVYEKNKKLDEIGERINAIIRPGVTIKEMGGLVNRKIYKAWWKENRNIYTKWLDDTNKWTASLQTTKPPVLEYKTKLKFINN